MAGGVQSLNIVIGANTEALKKGMDDAVKAVQGGGRTLEQDAKRVQKSMERMLRTATDPGANLKQQARQLTNLAGSYMQMGEQGSAAFKQVTQQAINAKRQMEDVNDAIMAADLEGKGKLAARGFSEATQAIAGMQGAMHLLGMDTKSAAEVTATLQSLMAMGAGIAGIVALEGTVTALTKRINLAATAQKVLNFAMSASGIGLIASGIALAATAYMMLKKRTYDVSQAMKTRNEVAESTREILNKEYGSSLALVAILRDETQTREDRNAALKKLQEEYPGYLQNVDLDKTKTGELKKEIDKLNGSIYTRAKAQAALGKLSEIAAKEIDLEIQRDREMEQLKKKGMQFAGESASIVEGATQRERDALKLTRDELGRVAEQRAEVLKILKETGAASDVIAGKQSASKTGTGKKSGSAAGIVPIPKPKDIADMARQNIAQAMLDIQSTPPPSVSEPLEILGLGMANFKENLKSKIHEAFDYAKVGVQERAFQIAMDIGNALDAGIKQMASNMAGALGDLAMNIVAGAEQPLQKFGEALLNTLSGFMQTLGQAMIAAGMASQKFQAMLFTNPIGAVVAGAGLIIAAGVVKGIMQSGMSGKKSSGDSGGGTAPGGIRPFADGGIISGPTLGLMGEYPGASSNPEVVAPLNKLKDLMGGSGNLTARISGQDLLIMLDRAETNRGRVR